MFYAVAMLPYGFWGMPRRYKSSLHFGKLRCRLLFGLCQLKGRGFTRCVVAAIESVNLTESSLHGSILQAPTQIPQKICYNFALSALQTQGAATISPHIANPLCFNE